MTEISIEIFKTNVQQQKTSREILTFLKDMFPNLSVSFDLEDCDKILRVEGTIIPIHGIIEALYKMGFICERIE